MFIIGILLRFVDRPFFCWLREGKNISLIQKVFILCSFYLFELFNFQILLYTIISLDWQVGWLGSWLGCLGWDVWVGMSGLGSWVG